MKIFRHSIVNHVQGSSLDITFDESTLDTPQVDALVYFPEAIILADSQSRVTYMNPAAVQLLGLPLEKARGHVLAKILTLMERESRRPVPLFDYFSRNMPFEGAFHYLENSEGGLMPVQCSMSRARTDLGVPGGYIVSLRNASGLQHYIDKLVTQTMHDEHTRLLRRAELIKRLWRLLQETDSGDPHAFLYLDLDNFKAVNDTAGHAAGDLAIRQIASRFKAVVRDRDTLARLGGDEFGLLLEHCPAELARERAQQLHRAVESYALSWNGETYRMGVSIGLAIFKTHNHSLNSILASADAACYQAKRSSGDGQHIHEVSLD